MAIKEQLVKIKENWLIAVLVLVLFLFVAGGSNLSRSFGSFTPQAMMGKVSMDYGESLRGGGYYPNVEADFAPEVEERKILKTTSMSTEVKRGTFQTSETKLKNIVSSSDSFILSENSNNQGSKRKSYYSGSYQIKVEQGKYKAVVSQLKEIGEVRSFNENARDVTGSYTNTQIELQTEKERLKRYQVMYDEAKEINDKLNLNDRIFNQERRIKYLEDSLKNTDKRIEYSTIHFSMTEKRSEYANLALVKISELIRGFVSSINALLQLVFVIIPWAIAFLIISWIVKLIKRKN